MSIWDDPEVKPADNYIKFEKVGDTVTGRIVNQRIHRFDDGKACAQILLDCDGEERTLTAGQIRLRAALSEARPSDGDLLTVTLSDVEKRSGGKTLKHFHVSVNGHTVGETADAPASAPAPTPAAAAGGGASEEEKAKARALLGL